MAKGATRFLRHGYAPAHSMALSIRAYSADRKIPAFLWNNDIKTENKSSHSPAWIPQRNLHANWRFRIYRLRGGISKWILTLPLADARAIIAT